ncbi:MAG: biotin--[acetyl-CoA-carboxylase] ligase [Candidatus Limimorpha sp.]
MELKVLILEEISSTNAFLFERMSCGEDVSDTVVMAYNQTRGRGMGSNSWISEPRKNLLFSIALRVPFVKAENQFVISQAVAVAIAGFLETLMKDSYINIGDIKIKWPNDIYFGDKKLAGILIQNTLSGMMMENTIIGVGININQIDFDEKIPNPISLKMITGEEYDVRSILEPVSMAIKDNVEKLSYKHCAEEINVSYLKRLYRYGEWADYDYNGEIKPMIMNGIDKYGRLMLSDSEGKGIVCDVKEVRFII